METPTHDKPCAVEGFISYRYPCYGGLRYVMIGAKDDNDALREANRSLTKKDATIEFLQVWDGNKYVPCSI